MANTISKKNFTAKQESYAEKALRKLLAEKRTNVCVKADYSKGSDLEKVIQSIIQTVAAESSLKAQSKELAGKLGIEWKN